MMIHIDLFRLISGLLILVILSGEEVPGDDSLATEAEAEVTEYHLLIDEEEYRIYSTTLLHILNTWRTPQPREYVIIKELTTFIRSREQNSIIWLGKTANIEVDTTLVQDFVAKNSTKYLLTDMFDMPQNIVLISDDELRGLYDGGELHERYPRGSPVFELSRVGFNMEHTCAIVSLTVNAHVGLGGSGYMALLIKKDSKWVVMECRVTWIG
jgi:hypothetical protein